MIRAGTLLQTDGDGKKDGRKLGEGRGRKGLARQRGMKNPTGSPSTEF